jgi:DNA-binding MarR family transcriptional regulator
MEVTAQATSGVPEILDENALYPEAGPLALFSHMSRVSLFLQALQEECLSPFGLRFVDYSVLRILDYSGAPHRMSPSRLAEAVVCTTGGMTRIVDRLERRGWCERTRDPADRRGVLVGLTEAGRRTSQEASDAYQKGRERILARLSSNEVDDLDAALRRILDVFEDDRRET